MLKVKPVKVRLVEVGPELERELGRHGASSRS